MPKCNLCNGRGIIQEFRNGKRLPPSECPDCNGSGKSSGVMISGLHFLLGLIPIAALVFSGYALAEYVPPVDGGPTDDGNDRCLINGVLS